MQQAGQHRRTIITALAAGVALLATVLLCACEPPDPSVWLDMGLERVVVTHVADGDTIEVERADGEVRRVRFLGIDTPELDTPEGQDAARYVRNVLPEGTVVWLQKDNSEVDQYGRLLRYVWLEVPDNLLDGEARDKMLNAILLEKGYAKVLMFDSNTLYAPLFYSLETSDGPGFWETLIQEAIELAKTRVFARVSEVFE